VGATPLLYDQLEYKMAAVMQGTPYRVVKTAKGLDVPGGPNTWLEGRVLCGQRETEGPFGEFPGYYSGCHKYQVIEIDRVSQRKDPIYDAVYAGRPWTEMRRSSSRGAEARSRSAPAQACRRTRFRNNFKH
jgi:4-hydroxybenzoate decarboxylase